MNKVMKLISILMIATMLIAMASPMVFAAVTPNKIEANYSVDTSGIQGVAGKILGAIRNIAAIVLVVLIAILGFKYMIGSVEERSDYKKSFIPLIVGTVVVLAASQLATVIFSIVA